jgi:hypothetical protein
MRKILFLAFLFAPIISCGLRVIHHNEHTAAEEAMEFAEMVLVQQDFQNGYSFLSDGFKNAHSPERFSELIIALHPKTYPLTVTAPEFEPILGKKQ